MKSWERPPVPLLKKDKDQLESNAELMKDGAHHTSDGEDNFRLKATDAQVEKARQEMDAELSERELEAKRVEAEKK